MSSPQRLPSRPAPLTALIVLAFAAVYLIWGSTYLAIRVAVQTLPPLTMAGVRFVFAGGLLYALLRIAGAPRPSALQWRSATLIGGLLLLGGNGGVAMAETVVESGIAALLVATVPLWMVLLEGLRPGGSWPNAIEIAGVLVGFAGVGVLIGPGWATASSAESGGVDLGGAALLVGASLSWAAGSLYARHAELPRSAWTATGMEMIAGGALLLVAGLLRGEWATLDVSRFSAASLLALAYLTVFGSLVGFTAYVWLLGVTTPTRVGTYAYVNPVVAVLLGWAAAGERLGAATFVAMGLILSAVVLINVFGRRARRVDVEESCAAPRVRETT